MPSATIRYFDLNLKDVEEEYNAPRLDMDLSTFATEEELEYLKTKRIEIDSVMIAINDNQKFWEYILKKLGEQFPTRDYNRAINIPEHVVPATLEKLNDMVRILSTHLTRGKRNEISSKYHDYEGFIDDVDEEEKANSEELKNVIERDKKVMEPLLSKIQDLINECGKKVDEPI